VALLHLPLDAPQLISMPIQDPPVPYAQISAKLGIPVGSIGPSRGRCLEKLRRYPAIAALINACTRPDAGCVPGLVCVASLSKAGHSAGVVTRRR
jgi:hypothetical protein